MRRFLLVALCAAAVASAMPASAGAAPSLKQVVAQHLHARWVSQGARGWLNPPRAASPLAHVSPLSVALGTNVDAGDPNEDLAAGQSETAIDATGSGRVLVAWNDATGFVVQPTNRLLASLTGVGYSDDGGRSFTDLVGLRNPNPDQQWSGDPAVVAIDGGAHFIVGSLYLPSPAACNDGKPAQLAVAVEVVTPTASGVSMGKPVIVSPAGNVCTLINGGAVTPNNLAFLDKDYLAWDQSSRTLAVSFTRFFISGGHSGQGAINLARAHVPVNATSLTSANFHTASIWHEEPLTENEGAYVALAPGGDAYVAWERNIDTNTFNGDPHIYEHVAFLPAHAQVPAVGGQNHPVVVTKGQGNATPAGGVRSLGTVAIAGYNRGTGNDFPRIAWNNATGNVDVVWNDASHHPLGDIWLRSYSAQLGNPSPIVQLNDDSDFTLHFLPAVSVRSNGHICSSWYDRRRFGPDSATTDYYGECRAAVGTQGADFRITTGATDWTNTSTVIFPNFGDYTDNASTGTTTYYTWSDGRLGVPQPFTDHH